MAAENGHRESLEADAAPAEGRLGGSRRITSQRKFTAPRFYLLVDSVAYKGKPSGREMGAITARLKRAEPAAMDEAGFCEAMKRGLTWVGATFGKPFDESAFIQQQLFALDFDNSTVDGDGGKRPLRAGEAGYLAPLDAVSRLEELGIVPMCLYFTKSATLENPRYRVVIDAGKPVTDLVTARNIIGGLLDRFPEADQSCKDVGRRFYGSNGEVWEYWKNSNGEYGSYPEGARG